MNLSYIVNALRGRPETKKTSYPMGAVTIEHDSVDCEGFNSLSIGFSGQNVQTSFDLILEGRNTSWDKWTKIPVYNSRYIIQPFISVENTSLTRTPDVENVYFANIQGFTQIRTSLVYRSGASPSINLILSASTFSINKPTIVRESIGITSLVPRDTEYIGRYFKVVDGGETDASLIRPIWIGDVSQCVITVNNNHNKPMLIDSISLFDNIDTAGNKYSAKIPISLRIEPNTPGRVSSVDFPRLTDFKGFIITVNQLNRTTGTTTGSYDLIINVKQ